MINKEEVAKKIAEMMANEYIKKHLGVEKESDIAIKATDIYTNAYVNSLQRINDLYAKASSIASQQIKELTVMKNIMDNTEHPKLKPVEEKYYTR